MTGSLVNIALPPGGGPGKSAGNALHPLLRQQWYDGFMDGGYLAALLITIETEP